MEIVKQDGIIKHWLKVGKIATIGYQIHASKVLNNHQILVHNIISQQHCLVERLHLPHGPWIPPIWPFNSMFSSHVNHWQASNGRFIFKEINNLCVFLFPNFASLFVFKFFIHNFLGDLINNDSTSTTFKKNVWGPTSVREENETFLIRVWKPPSCRRVLKLLSWRRYITS